RGSKRKYPPTVRLRKESILNLCKFHWYGALLVVVRHVVHPSADGIAPHQPSIAGFQQIGCRSYILHPRIEPQVVAVWIENDWHSVVDGCGHSAGRTSEAIVRKRNTARCK